MVKQINEYVYQVQYLRTREEEEVHASKPMFSNDSTPDTDAHMSHVLQSENGMPDQPLMRMENHPDGVYSAVRWKG